MDEKPTAVYVTYIKTTADKVWQAITEGEIARQFWGGMQNVSDAGWQAGTPWRHVMADSPDSIYGVGQVVESVRPNRLKLTWAAPEHGDNPDMHAHITYDILEDQGVVRLTVTSIEPEPAPEADEAWPMILSGLKSLLETGEPLPPFWEREGDDWKTIRFADA